MARFFRMAAAHAALATRSVPPARGGATQPGTVTPPTPPSTLRCPLGGYDGSGEGVRILEGWIGRKLPCRSFYSGWPGSFGYEPTNSARDPDWPQRSIIMVNAPNDANAASDATTRNRLRAGGQMDAAMIQAADGLASVLAANSNYQTVVLVENESQCFWNGLDGGYDVEAWKEGVRRCYNICKSRLGSSLIYALCPSHNWPPDLVGNGSRNCSTAWLDWYPGDAYCDAVGNTLYSTTRPSSARMTVYGSTVEQQLTDARNEWGPEAMFNFATQRGKRFVLSEYGPMWSSSEWGYYPPSWYDQEQANFFQYSFDRWLNKSTTALCVAFHEWSGDGYHRLDNLPIARAKFVQLWS